MGYVFEELIRKFNEENNEEAGEHFTPREVIELMTHLVFDPVKNKLPPVMSISTARKSTTKPTPFVNPI